ncbi:Gfo/Idh/MocA family oxidoreductase [Caulobacter sp. 17J65-9]|uniref:Gfo/Idh/MocA family protein n=1 Tax=Caulobacter sp. 17J65-9 TaxID=2709382 RepID=UPI0013CB02B9|nr:Gfo/Idh/MocA family oxidoreductase [Caulobacter sp. 17J65-9]NEX92206.1 Gfo/Idh/MocA family oxidoreductase [Caulobacter sp. 17J65-9]
MSKILKAGVAGAGVFGGHHARKYAQSEGVELVGVYDRGTGRALALAEQIGARGFEADEWDAFIDGLDVLTVAAPAVAHAQLAVRALERGVHVYVEKPLAASVQEAEAIRAAAQEAGRVLACGHQERIVFGEMGLLTTPERPIRLEAVRKGPWTGRSDDVSVVLDLMIHDLDLALALAGSEPSAVTSKSETIHGPRPDHTRAEITFAGGMTAVFEASRAAEARERTMRVVYPSGEVNIDFLARTFENTTPFALNAGFADTVRGKDPLGASVGDFLAAVRGEASRPAVTGEEAARALALALAVDDAAA